MADTNFEAYESLIKTIEMEEKIMSELPAGSKERAMELENYQKLIKLKTEMENQDDRLQLDRDRLRMEKENAEITNKSEKKKFWLNLGATALGIAVPAGLGLLTLKYNMEFGGLCGKDSKGYIQEIAKIKPTRM